MPPETRNRWKGKGSHKTTPEQPGQEGLFDLDPRSIMQKSFQIIEDEFGPHGYPMGEWQVVRRVIHATGDMEAGRAVRFYRDAVLTGVRALRKGSPIVTDVQMVAAGIRKDRLSELGIQVHCFIDHRDVEARARDEGMTRGYWAMQMAMDRVGSAVYLIGNAPTALHAVCRGVAEGRVAPDLLVAVPVGFVAVVESKEQAAAVNSPLITLTGRKGGSPVASAIVNALMELAVQGA